MTLGAARPGDVRGRLDPVESAAYLAAVTSRIGLVVETPVVGTEPFHLANRLASLDWAAQGRAGWAVDVPAGADASEAREVVDAVRALWDTWEDGVFLADERTGRFLDLDRWHYADVQGEHFSIKGPAITPRPPQGHLPVVGGDVVFGGADVVRVGGADVQDALARADAARRAGATRVLLDVEVLLDADRPAAERLATLDDVAPWAPTAALRVTGSAGRPPRRPARGGPARRRGTPRPGRPRRRPAGPGRSASCRPGGPRRAGTCATSCAWRPHPTGSPSGEPAPTRTGDAA